VPLKSGFKRFDRIRKASRIFYQAEKRLSLYIAKAIVAG